MYPPAKANRPVGYNYILSLSYKVTTTLWVDLYNEHILKSPNVAWHSEDQVRHTTKPERPKSLHSLHSLHSTAMFVLCLNKGTAQLLHKRLAIEWRWPGYLQLLRVLGKLAGRQRHLSTLLYRGNRGSMVNVNYPSLLGFPGSLMILVGTVGSLRSSEHHLW